MENFIFCVVNLIPNCDHGQLLLHPTSILDCEAVAITTTSWSLRTWELGVRFTDSFFLLFKNTSDLNVTQNLAKI